MKLYIDKDWLEHQYIDLEKSITDIGKECNVSPQTIYRWLKRFEIPIRNNSESSILFNQKKRKIYKDKGWLYEQYISLHKSIVQIAKECNTSTTPIYYWLLKHKIPIRSKEEWNKFYWNKESYRKNQIEKKKGKNNSMVLWILSIICSMVLWILSIICLGV